MIFVLRGLATIREISIQLSSDDLFFCRPFDFTLGKSGTESNPRDAVSLADRAGTEIVIPGRFSYQQPKQGEKFSAPIVLSRRFQRSFFVRQGDVGILGARVFHVP
jgi:hypothetical protein